MNRLWSQVRPASIADPLEIALAEIDVAITLVRRGQARRVRLIGLSAGERAAGPGLARAQEARVRFTLQRAAAPGVAVSLVIGPAIDD
ncbi:MAG: hypothetical protein H0U37_08865 [Chloroflexi bacterium]|nr:hypothetical protein [Chloroflexota bacterium]